MPNRKTHSLVGMTAGAGYAAYQAKGQFTSKVWAELLGGAVGGYFAGQLPDVLEPAIHSWHRSIAHSGTVATTVLATARTKAISWQDHCRKQAEACRIKRQSLKMVPHPSQPNLYVVDPSAQWEHLCLSIEELIWHFAAGIVNGAAAGYVSHLALDAATPRSIPLLVNGF